MLGFQRNGTRWYYLYPDEAPVLEKCFLFSIQIAAINTADVNFSYFNET